MGEEYTYICSDCGYETSLIVGIYNCKGWGDPISRKEITEGRYGKKAKKVFEDHPKCNFHFQADIFRCECGYVKSYDSLLIHESDPLSSEIFFSTCHRCPRCRKAMTRMDHFPVEIACHKCGGRSDISIGSHSRW